MKTQINRFKKFATAVIVISGLLFYSSCKKESGPIIITPTNAPPISLAKDIQPIFTANCATGGCHNNTSHKAFLNLTLDSTYSNTVNVIANNYGPAIIVVPFSSATSVLWDKVSMAGAGLYGGEMPQAGPLSQTDQDLIKKWIDQGANP